VPSKKADPEVVPTVKVAERGPRAALDRPRAAVAAAEHPGALAAAGLALEADRPEEPFRKAVAAAGRLPGLLEQPAAGPQLLLLQLYHVRPSPARPSASSSASPRSSTCPTSNGTSSPFAAGRAPSSCSMMTRRAARNTIRLEKSRRTVLTLPLNPELFPPYPPTCNPGPSPASHFMS
jgi:hypothetical protein